MDNKQFIHSYMKKSSILLLVPFIVFLWFPQRVPLITGLVFGHCIRILLFKLHSYELSRILNAPPQKAKRMAVFSYTKRFLIYGLTLTLAILNPRLHVLGAFLGLLMLPITIHLLNLKNITMK
ncbi:MAG: ATP synthase subunit I [Tissierellia bacterium]|nr:ATP synthase subunit I [Tissierellia bacterium]